MEISKSDQAFLLEKNISEELLNKQLEQLKNGFLPLNITDVATGTHGIKKYTDDETNDYIAFFEEVSQEYDLLKFIPASGASTRMFKKLFEFRNTYKGSVEEYRQFIGDTSVGSVHSFFENLEELPFFKELEAICYEKAGISIEEMLEEHRYVDILDYVLYSQGLNLGFKPKALIDFHRYEEKNRTPLAEHLVAVTELFKGQKSLRVHFTVTEEFLPYFQEETKTNLALLKEKYGVDINVDYSFQKTETDTIAVTKDNNLFRTEDGKLLFRPGGHGALIHNLNDMKDDILFIKNIDNVVPDWMKEKNIPYEKLLGGVLLTYQQRIFSYLEQLEGETSGELLDEIKNFITVELCYKFGEERGVNSAELRKVLNRPLRVCGMVVNEGEPGGGPFFVKDKNGNISLQIVESSQIDLTDERQKEIFEKSTHFNPVDIVCGVKDYKGNKFDLLDFVDEEAGFITNKSLNGRNLKALELPGLWNGAMANWNTIFVEVPDFTFNPVKTVWDLLRPQHRN